MCKPKIKKMGGFLKTILSNNIAGITLAPFGIYLDERYLNNPFFVNHEKIHWKQQMEMLIIFFYLWYGIEWLIKVFKYGRRQAYYTISFEREAYNYDQDPDYLESRKTWAWFKYINNYKRK